MIIQHNIMALNSYNKLSNNNSAVQKNLEKLSSGYRINRAGDDAAGLAISEKMRAQITGLERAKLNAQDGISLVQTAEGALTEVHSMLNRLVELGTESANGIYQADDRMKIQAEVDQIGAEIDRISKATNFNGIKLLNGDLSLKENTSVSLESGGVDFSDGMEITNTAGQGAQSEFSIEIKGTFGEGDTITINYDLPSANGMPNPQQLTLTYSDTAITANDGALTFSGDTKEDQMQSIMDRLMQGTHASLANFGANLETQQVTPTANKYTIGVEGSKLTIKANDEGFASKLAIKSVVTNNVDAGLSTSITTPASAMTNAGKINGADEDALNYLITSETNVQAGDKLEFNFTLSNGKAATVELDITADMISSSHHTTTENIVNALMNSKFKDNTADTTYDESQYKVSDFFTLTANKGVKAGGGAIENQTGSIRVQRTQTAFDAALTTTDFRVAGVKRYTAANPAVGEDMFSTAVAPGNKAAKVQTSSVDIMTFGGADKEKKTATLDKNLTVGDKYVLEGTLADGRKFKVQLEVGEQADLAHNIIAKGATKNATAANIAAALQDSGVKMQITNAAGDDLGTMAADKVFGGTGASGMTVAAAGNTVTFTQNQLGTGRKMVNGSITDPAIVPGEAAKAEGIQITEGVDQGSALSTIDFNDLDKLEYGTTITIGSKQFELVAGTDSELSEAGNIRVVLDSLDDLGTTGEDVAKAFMKAINDELVDSAGKITDYAAELGVASADDVGVLAQPDSTQAGHNINLAAVTAGTSKLEIKSIKEGGDVEKVDVKDTYGNKENTTMKFAKNEDGSLKLKAGDTVIINGKTYQFDTDVRNAEGTNSVIKVEDFTDEKKIAEAVKTALNIDDPTVDVKINDDNSVTFSGSGKNTAPTVEIGKDDGGLTLQIGDTADSYNKVTVSVEDMSTKGLGIYELQVTDQGLSSDSIDKVKNAIERVSVTRGNLGALQNRLEHTINNLATTTENMTAAESRIRDTDMAKEMMHFTKNNVLVQAAQAMLAQANQQPQQILQLLR